MTPLNFAPNATKGQTFDDRFRPPVRTDLTDLPFLAVYMRARLRWKREHLSHLSPEEVRPRRRPARWWRMSAGRSGWCSTVRRGAPLPPWCSIRSAPQRSPNGCSRRLAAVVPRRPRSATFGFPENRSPLRDGARWGSRVGLARILNGLRMRSPSSAPCCASISRPRSTPAPSARSSAPVRVAGRSSAAGAAGRPHSAPPASRNNARLRSGISAWHC
jgi:hypothetical protein